MLIVAAPHRYSKHPKTNATLRTRSKELWTRNDEVILALLFSTDRNVLISGLGFWFGLPGVIICQSNISCFFLLFISALVNTASV